MFGPDVDAEILTRAQETDEEICGVIADGRPVFLPNVADDPKESFIIRDLPDNYEAIFHSHPGGPFHPSSVDMRQQYATMLPWGIACTHWRHNEVFWFGDTAPKSPLIGRGFRHGVTDCYELVRDFYRDIHDIHLPHVPREWSWWSLKENLYEEHLTQAGFYPINMADIQPGDGILLAIKSDVANHAAVYLGNGLMMHHPGGFRGYDPARLSRRESVARWHSHIVKVVRHKDVVDRTVGQRIPDENH